MFWQEYLPQPILFSFGPLIIHWYGLILVLAILVSAGLARRYFLKKGIISSSQFEDLVFYVIIFGLLGARFGHVVFFNLAYYLQNPLDVFKVWQGGLAIQGALLFGFLTLLIWSYKKKINFWKLADGLALAVPLGQAIGRWGNYFNQELFGRPTSGWWGVPIAPFNRVAGYGAFSHFHPIFFYESFLSFILFIILYRLAFKSSLKLGQITLFYFLGYGLIRFFVEFFRIDDTFMLGGVRIAQIIAWLLILAVYYVYKFHKNYKIISTDKTP